LRSSASVAGKAAARRATSGAGDQVAGAGIIAEPGPFAQHLLVGRGGERLDRRPALDEAAKRGITVATVVCCSITSLSHTR
jgi:hypothetical protein